ncbi:RsfA family transcriptional regulator [Priestia abyssalis]|uniref:RsfA family transcriptional regulator n=1 Tax=Priestia abyssalis TaxID=1221450 RepID=UPI00099598BE|nr:RsfA family transcriptional regulator [Priestia abyssalis]
MTSSRQDAWTQDEDLLLAEVVLRHIREGGTQLAAFEEVGKTLSRTAAACGFRWNSYVRKQYKAGIELAKKQRKELKAQLTLKEVSKGQAQKVNYGENTVVHEYFTLGNIIQFLQKLERSQYDSGNLVEQNQDLQQKIEFLESQVERLEREKNILENNLLVVEDDYKALIEIMDRARKMVVLNEGEKGKKMNFQVDKSSQLEKIEK